MPPRDPKNTFFRIELNIIGLKCHEGEAKIIDHAIGMLRLDYDIIYISLNSPPNEFAKDGIHATLVCGASGF
jgi:methylmalonyl-CoA mutase cobalamin-binding subunit